MTPSKDSNLRSPNFSC